MKSRTSTIALLSFAYAALGAAASAYLAAILYFAVNKTVPDELTFKTWWRYWQAYSDNPVQHARLVGSALVATVLVYGAPLVAMLRTLGKKRALHGDARWATESEIRDAGLL